MRDEKQGSLVENSARRRDHMANERTFLAWIRTCIGITIFGFVVEKFSIFVREFSLFFRGKKEELSYPLPGHEQFASILGMCLVALGALLMVFALIKYKKHEHQISNDIFETSPILATTTTLFLVIGALSLLVYLLLGT